MGLAQIVWYHGRYIRKGAACWVAPKLRLGLASHPACCGAPAKVQRFTEKRFHSRVGTLDTDSDHAVNNAFFIWTLQVQY